MKSILRYAVFAALVIGLVAGGAWAAYDSATLTVNGAKVNSVTVGVKHGGGPNYYIPYDQETDTVGTVNANDPIELSFTVGASGPTSTNTVYPDTQHLTASTLVKPDGASDVSVSGLTDCVFPSPASTARTTKFNRIATFTAPATAGAYQVKFLAHDDRTGSQGKMNDDSFLLNFTVVVPGCTPAPTTLELGTPDCVVYKATSVSFSATLTSDDTALAGKTITFLIDGNEVGTADTDINGVATLNFDPSSLRVGEYTLSAEWQSDNKCFQNATATGVPFGIQYLFKGFQPPINADGSTVLTGKCGPVKIIILDANGVPVPDATACVYFADGIQTIVGTEPTNATAGLNFDYGNVMRYSDGQYVYNWDLSTVSNGQKTICVDLGEGTCAGQHLVVVSVGKKNK